MLYKNLIARYKLNVVKVVGMQIDRQLSSTESDSPPQPREIASAVWVDPTAQHTMLEAYLTNGNRGQVLQATQVQQMSPSPIPQRASAVHSGLSKIRPHSHGYAARITKALEDDVTQIPTVPQGGSRQHDATPFAVESSLPTLSLLQNQPDQMPTMPIQVSPVTPQPMHSVSIDKLKTQPALRRDSKNNITSGARQHITSSVRHFASAPLHTGWGNFRSRQATSTRLAPVEQVRWWLLYPGRIEFLLWFGGTLLLLTMTCLFVFVSMLSMGWLSNHTTGATTAATSPANTTRCTGTACTIAMPQLALLTHGPLASNMALHLHGQGFSSNAHITLTHDNGQACQPATLQADARGNFTLVIQLGTLHWPTGTHSILAYDAASKQSASITFELVAATSAQATTPVSPIVTPTTPADVTNGSSTLPAPAGQTPIAATPTAGTTPIATPTPPKPKPTPTVGLTPTATVKPSPTVGITPTRGTTPPAHSHNVAAQSLALQDSVPHVGLPEGLLLTLVIIGYSLALLLLGCAGLLYRRRRS